MEDWIVRTLEYADELVLLVDESSTDMTHDIACSLADRVHLVEHPAFTEVFHDIAMRQASGEWILWLDDDELMSQSFVGSRDRLLRDPHFTHYYVPYRWVVRDEAGRDRWLSTFPWHPNPRLRLVRNVGSIWSHRGRLHSPLEVLGEGRLLDPEEGVVYHLDLALRSREERERKVARYRGNNAPSCEEYYLYEDYAHTLVSEPVTEPLGSEPTAKARSAADDRRDTAAQDRSGPRLSVEQAQSSTARHWSNAPIFAAEYSGSTTPQVLLCNRGYTVKVTLGNASTVAWRTSGDERGRVVLSYRWVSPELGVILREGDRSMFPNAVAPGQQVTLSAGLWSPYDPGDYTLEWDLRSEHVAWFSERGVAPLRVAVTVSGDDRLLGRPRSVAMLPPRVAEPAPERPAAKARLRALAVRASHLVRAARGGRSPSVPNPPCNLVTIDPVRVLDTRDGSGVPGAVHGPVAAGKTVSLTVAGHGAIPDYTVGVVGTLSVPQASYNGFLNLLPGGARPVASGIVTAYFDADRPTSSPVTCALDDGRLSIWISDNFPGKAQLILDLNGYLSP